MRNFTYLTSCVDAPGLPGMTYGDAVDAIQAMQGAAVGITRDIFLRHVRPEDMRRLEDQLGYAQHVKRGLMMAKDWHVGYYKSVFRGKPCYYFDHSRIEYIFTRPDAA